MSKIFNLSLSMLKESRSPQTLMYHGTSSVFLRKILKEGLKPKPENRVYEEGMWYDENYYETYGGSYFTRLVELAWGGAVAASNKFGGNELYVGALIPERSPARIPDEDSYTLKKFYRKYMDLSVREVLDILSDAHKMSEVSTELRDFFITETFFKEENATSFALKMVEHLKKELEELAETVILHVLYWKYFSGFVDPEDGSLIEEYFKGDLSPLKSSLRDMRELHDKVLRKWGKVLSWSMDTVRMLEGVGYRGAARIVFIVEIFYKSPEVDVMYPYPFYRIHYAKSEGSTYLTKFLSRWASYRGTKLKEAEDDV